MCDAQRTLSGALGRRPDRVVFLAVVVLAGWIGVQGAFAQSLTVDHMSFGSGQTITTTNDANAPGGTTWWYARATTTGQGGNAAVTFSDGTFDAGSDSTSGQHSISGSFNAGPNGTIVFHVPRADVGNPADGATLKGSFADTAGAYLVAGTGIRYTARADRAPDSNGGADYNVAQAC